MPQCLNALMPNTYLSTMGRILAIDYGTKRCGIAVTDPSRIIATGLTTVHSKDVIEWLKNYTAKESVETIVVGDPKDLRGNPTDATRMANEFVVHLKKHFPAMNIVRVDERFTSKMATKTILDSGLKKKDRQNKELIDEVSATILLQHYLGMH